MRAERYYKQTITYWAPGPIDGFANPTFGTPISFLGRWEEHSEDVIGPKGDVVKTSSMVNYPQDFALAQEGYLALGKFLDKDPRTVTTANRIQFLSEIPDLRGLQTVKVALL